MTATDYARLRALAEAATPGGRTPDGSLIVADGGATVGQAFGINWRNDQAYLAAIDPPTLIALLGELERLRGETEWEYGVADDIGDADPFPSRTRETAEKRLAAVNALDLPVPPAVLVRRRKAGPWEPVEEETDE